MYETKCIFCGGLKKHSRLCHFDRDRKPTNLDKSRKDKSQDQYEGKEGFRLDGRSLKEAVN